MTYEAAEDADDFAVILEKRGRRTQDVIQKVRELKSIGFARANWLVSSAPAPLLEHVDKETAYKAKAELEAVGATVTVR